MHLDPRLVMAVVTVESHWNESAVSVDGAIGLGQFKPETAQDLGIDARVGKSNLKGITLYLHRLIGIFASSRHAMSAAIASYNAGPLAVEAAGGSAPGFASQHYVDKVFATWRSFKARLSPQTEEAPIDTVAELDRAQASYWGAP
jgi:soluble lytic murein transglycosylase-like protein